MAARVDDERSGRQQRFDLFEQEQALLAMRNQARRGRVQDCGRAFDLRRQRRDAGLRARRCSARASAARAALVRRRRIAIPATTSSWAALDAGGKRRGVELGERALGLVEAADQEQAPDLEIPRMRGVHAVAVRFERRPRRVERLRRPAQVARDERDLGLGDDAPRARHGLSGTEGARRAPQQSLRADEIAELRHRDAAKRERRRVVAQGDPLQRAEGIARGERPRRGGDQRVHRNPVTLVTPAVRRPAANYLTDQQRAIGRLNDIALQPQRHEAIALNPEVAMTTITSAEKGRKEGQHAMNTPPIVSPQEWEAAREQLLVKEKALTRARDALAAERRRMPWMAVEKAYAFDGPRGKASLLDLFEGRRQLIVYRAFFEPGVHGWPEHACIGCSLGADQVGPPRPPERARHDPRRMPRARRRPTSRA